MKNANIMMYLSSFYKTNVFKSKVDKKAVALYSLVMLIIVGVLSIIRSNYVFLPMGKVETFLSAVIGVPLLFLLLFFFVYIFLNALEDKRKKFFESYLVFFAIALPFIVLGNLVTLIDFMVYNATFSKVVSIIEIIIFVYFIVNMIRNFNNYYGTNAYKFVTAGILALIVISSILTLTYINGVAAL